METTDILSKIKLVGLSEEEEKKAIEKFPALAFVSTEEIIAVLDVLARKGEKITKARELKVLTNPVSKIEKNFDFVEEAHELGIYSEDLNRLNGNGVDIFKRIRYCNQFNIPYKNEDGTYKDFIFKENLFQNEINKSINTIEENNLIGTEPEVNIPEIDMNPKENAEIDLEHQDIHDYMQATSDLDDIEAKTTTFAQIKQDLEAQLAELDSLKAQNEQNNDNIYHFNDYANIEGETYNVGRGRAA